jgi:hemerythrin-like metal-binding protein
MHFAAEERLMQQAGYPDLQSHKEAHEKLLAKVQDYQRRFQGGDRSVTAEISQFLMTDWLVKHILGMDELYAPYMKKTFSDAAGKKE